MVDTDLVTGTPPALLMPARPHRFRFKSDLVNLVVPIRGTFPKTYNRVEGPFNLNPEPGVLLYGTMVDVLFAHIEYPSLEDNQRFVILGTELHDEDNEFHIIGRVVELVGEEEADAQ